MKVIDLINKLNEIGYDEKTELTFSCIDGLTGECYSVPFDEISYGEDLTGEPYCNDVIDIGLDVDSCEEYIKSKSDDVIGTLVEDLAETLNRYLPIN